MIHHHVREVCEGCGTVLVQCRCAEPKVDVPKGRCVNCSQKEQKPMTEEKKRPNGEVAKEICKEVYGKRWPVSLELSIKQALDEKDKEIARLRTQVNPLYQDLAGRLIGHIMENSDNHDIELALLEIINSAKKSRTEVLRLNGLLERRTNVLRILYNADPNWAQHASGGTARQALQDDGKGER